MSLGEPLNHKDHNDRNTKATRVSRHRTHFVQYGYARELEVTDSGKSALVSDGVIHNDVKGAGYGLRNETLSPMETLAQSISGACPTLSPFVTVPLVYTLAGNGTWLAYVLGTCGILLVAWCISRFARYTSSPGSLYSYAAMILPPWLAATTA